MVNDVNPVNSSIVGSSRSAEQNKLAKTSAQEQGVEKRSPTDSNADTVQLSDQAQEMARVQRSLAQLPEIDKAKVDEIRQQIESGSYSVDVEALADKILNDEQFFNG